MNISKRLFKHPRTITAFSYLLAGFIHIVFATARKRYVIAPEAQPYIAGRENAIFAFWHGRMMLLPKAMPLSRSMHMLISRHRDGVLISQVIGHLGVATVSGSSSRGGGGAVREMLRLLGSGGNVGITPDGPRGPNQKINSDGVITLARLSGKPVIPVTFSASHCIRLKSWDKFMVALPFSRITFCAGTPITVSDKADDALREHMEQAMNQTVNIAGEIAA